MDYVLEIAIALFFGGKNVHRRAIYAPGRKSESKNKNKNKKQKTKQNETKKTKTFQLRK